MPLIQLLLLFLSTERDLRWWKQNWISWACGERKHQSLIWGLLHPRGQTLKDVLWLCTCRLMPSPCMELTPMEEASPLYAVVVVLLLPFFLICPKLLTCLCQPCRSPQTKWTLNEYWVSPAPPPDNLGCFFPFSLANSQRTPRGRWCGTWWEALFPAERTGCES